MPHAVSLQVAKVKSLISHFAAALPLPLLALLASGAFFSPALLVCSDTADLGIGYVHTG